MVHAEIGDLCPYRRVCTMRHDERHPVHCIRGFALAEMLRIRLEEDFDWKLERFGQPCRLTLSRTRWGERDGHEENPNAHRGSRRRRRPRPPPRTRHTRL